MRVLVIFYVAYKAIVQFWKLQIVFCTTYMFPRSTRYHIMNTFLSIMLIAFCLIQFSARVKPDANLISGTLYCCSVTNFCLQ